MTTQHLALRLILITAALALASNLRASEIFADGFEGPCGPPEGWHPVGYPSHGQMARYDEYDEITNNGEPFPGAAGLRIETVHEHRRYIAARFVATDVLATAKLEHVPYAGSHYVKRVSISQCPGEFDDVPFECRFAGQFGDLWFSVGQYTPNHCQIELGQTYYVNIAFMDLTGSDTCPENKTKCTAMMTPRWTPTP